MEPIRRVHYVNVHFLVRLAKEFGSG